MLKDLTALSLLDKLPGTSGRSKTPVGLFGFSDIARLVIDKIEKMSMDISVVCIIDNDTNKQGNTYMNIPVISADELDEIKPDYILITSLAYVKEIKQQLLNKRINSESIIDIDSELEKDYSTLLGLGSDRIEKTLKELSVFYLMQIFFHTVLPKIEEHAPFSVNHLLKVFNQIVGALADTDFNIKDANILEVGGGRNPFGVPLIFQIHGANFVHVIDIDTYETEIVEYSNNRLISDSLINPEKFGLDENARKDLWPTYQKIFQFPNLIPVNNTFFSVKNVEDTSFPNQEFDLVYSNAVFEHIENLESALSEISRITRKGGYGAHLIDFRDHRDFAKPWDFLTLSPEQWNKVLNINTSDQTGTFINRLRLSQVEKMFEKNGFEIIKVIPETIEEIPAKIYNKLSHDYKSMNKQDLNTLIAIVVVKKVC